MALVKMFQITHVQPLPTPFRGDPWPIEKIAGYPQEILPGREIYVRKCKKNDPENFFKNGSPVPVPSFPEITVLDGIVKNFREGSAICSCMIH